MTVVITGSSGHLGEALVRVLRGRGVDTLGIDLIASPFTDRVGSIVDPVFVQDSIRAGDVVVHAATLHKPHIVSHDRTQFVATNVQGTLNVLETALAVGAKGTVFISTTSTFGAALSPAPGEPAVWITEDVLPIPKNVYGVTKVAAEDMCELFYRSEGLPCIVLKTSRFFPEGDDDLDRQRSYDDLNLKVNELLYRRVDLADAVDAVLLAIDKLVDIGFSRYIISATTPFSPHDAAGLGRNTTEVLRGYHPEFEALYAAQGWRMLPLLDRVYSNRKARDELGWAPKVDFGEAMRRLADGRFPFDPLMKAVGKKMYHPSAARERSA